MSAVRKLATPVPEIGRRAAYRPARKDYQHSLPRHKPGILAETLPFCALMVVLFLIGALLVSTSGREVAINYRTQQVKTEIASLHEKNAGLRLQLQKMSSLERIEYLALTELGMQYPDQRQWLYLSSHLRFAQNNR